MNTIVFDTHPFEQEQLEQLNGNFKHSLKFVDVRLQEETAALAQGFPCVCSFAHDRLNRATLTTLKKGGTQLIALRSAGYNHVDLPAAKELGLKVVRVPKYSPYSVAEHATTLILTLNRKIHRACQRVRELNFSLNGLVGFDMHGKTVGVIGTGKIGTVFCHIMLGFGCRVIAFDKEKNPELVQKGVQYLSLEEVLKRSDIISLHVPLNPETKHLINAASIGLMKKGVMLINTGRGALVDTHTLIDGLKNHHIGAAGLDVYEEEEEVFFKDLSSEGLKDDQLARLLTFPNVVITAHQGFLTQEALHNIAETTLQNIQDFEQDKTLKNEVL